MIFYGQFSPKVDEVLFRRYFPNKRDGFFIECGAYNGISDSSCKFFEESMGWKGINIEASPRLFQRVLINRPTSFLNLNAALSDHDGCGLFQEHVGADGELYGEGKLTHQIGVNVVKVDILTYSSLIRRYNVSRVDLLVLDVEGHEIEVFKGMEGCQVIPDVICAEYSFSGLENIKVSLAKFGFKFDFIEAVNAYFSRA